MGFTIAVLGVKGTLFPYVTNGFTSDIFKDRIDFPIRAITRDISELESNEYIKYYSANASDTSALEKILKGVDSVVALTSKDLDLKGLIDACVNVGVKLFLPSEFGSDHRFSRFRNTFAAKRHNALYARSQGLKTVCLQTGKFMEFSLGEPLINGIDKGAWTYRPVDGGHHKQSYTSLQDIGYSIVSLLTYPKPRQLPDFVFVQGDSKSANNMVEIFERYHGALLRVLPPVDRETAIDVAAQVDVKPNPTMDDFFLIIQAEAIMPYKAIDFSEKHMNDLVNPSLFTWQTVESLAEAFYSHD